MLSDVIGDPMDVIASGPTVPDPSTFKTCNGILDKYGIAEEIPSTVRERFTAGAGGEIVETPKPGDEALARCQNLVVGSNGLAVVAAQGRAAELGYNTLVLSTRVEGEAREVVNVYTSIAKEIVTSGTPLSPPACVIAGGETTVTVRGEGKGGRNQELVLAGAIQLAGTVKGELRQKAVSNQRKVMSEYYRQQAQTRQMQSDLALRIKEKHTKDDRALLREAQSQNVKVLNEAINIIESKKPDSMSMERRGGAPEKQIMSRRKNVKGWQFATRDPADKDDVQESVNSFVESEERKRALQKIQDGPGPSIRAKSV